MVVVLIYILDDLKRGTTMERQKIKKPTFAEIDNIDLPTETIAPFLDAWMIFRHRHTNAAVKAGLAGFSFDGLALLDFLNRLDEGPVAAAAIAYLENLGYAVQATPKTEKMMAQIRPQFEIV